MNSNDKLTKVKSIIDSCTTYEQTQSCLSFTTDPFFTDMLDKFKVFGYIQDKVYALRNEDILFHQSELKRISSTI